MSSSICAEQHKLHTSHQLLSSKKQLKNIDIPPRKLLAGRRFSTQLQEADMYYSDSPRFSSSSSMDESTLLRKFLPYNGGDDDSDDSDPYSSDHFRMYEFKVRRCTRSRSHDWTDCPFAHPGEKARRRDPRRFHYSGQVCPEYRRGGCSRSDSCEFAHGVFECWLHPARYRTEACKDGKNCKRKVCFFAHTPRQLRILPLNSQNSSPSTELPCKKKFLKSSGSNHCCLFCHCATSSPTSTLLGMSHLSPPLSPPLSPLKQRSITGLSPISRYTDRFVSSESGGGIHQLNNPGVPSYRDVLTELMSSFEAMNFSEEASPVSAKSPNVPWVDVSFNNEDQPQFILSPSAPSSYGSENFFSGHCSSKSFVDDDGNNKNNNNNNKNKVNVENPCSCSDPDLGWVNELLM